VHQGGTPPILHSENEKNGWGVAPGEFDVNLAERAAERRRTGITGRGNALMGSLLEACLASGVTLVANVRATALRESGGAVTGVEAEREGVAESYEARRGVLLASGGFEWNEMLVKSFIGVGIEAPLSPPFNDGDALKMASRAGARLAQTGTAWWVPSVTIGGETVDGRPSHRLFPMAKGLPGAIGVNRYGRRFANEALNYNDYGHEMRAFDSHAYEFPNLPAWVILDREHRERYPLDTLTRHHDDNSAERRLIYSAPTLRELAERIEVDADGLEAQVREFNRHAEDGEDPVFHRGESAWETYRADPQYANPALRPLGAGPYSAYRQRLGCFGTKGGPAIDEHARVLDLDDRPIPGLFAAGNASACVFGPSYPGGGATLGAGVVFGSIAGEAATS
jgi:succinate dehydrogenase/fumarate reductase flavoprotein subunit